MVDSPSTASKSASKDDAAPAAQALEVSRPQPGELRIVDLDRASDVSFDFGLEEGRFIALDVDVIIAFTDGAKLLLPNLGLLAAGMNPPKVRFAGRPMSWEQVFSSVTEVTISDPTATIASVGQTSDAGKAQGDPSAEQASAAREADLQPAPLVRLQRSAIDAQESATAPSSPAPATASSLDYVPKFNMLGSGSSLRTGTRDNDFTGYYSTSGLKVSLGVTLLNSEYSTAKSNAAGGLDITGPLGGPGSASSDDYSFQSAARTPPASTGLADHVDLDGPAVAAASDKVSTLVPAGWSARKVTLTLDSQTGGFTPASVSLSLKVTTNGPTAESGDYKIFSLDGKSPVDSTGSYSFPIDPENPGQIQFYLYYKLPTDSALATTDAFGLVDNYGLTLQVTTLSEDTKGNQLTNDSNVYFGLKQVASADDTQVTLPDHTVYVLWANPPGASVDLGGGADTVISSAGADTMVGGDGVDVVSYERSNSAIQLNMNVGVASSGGYARGDVFNDEFENVIATKYDDSILGNSRDNEIWGAGGRDTIDGGAGSDTVDYSDSADGVTVDLTSSAPQTGGGAEGDILINVENIIGSATGPNVLTGNAQDNRLVGGAANDVFYGSAGADTYVGGAGVNVVHYESYGADLSIDLVAGDIRFENIQTLYGVSDHANTFIGDNNAYFVKGGSAGDWLQGGALGDTFVGGDGSDTFLASASGDSIVGGDDSGRDLIDYSRFTTQEVGRLVINEFGAVFIPDGGLSGTSRDNISGIEDFTGAKLVRNLITGSAEANSITGGDLADTLVGAAGKDTLSGGDGADSLVGGGDGDYVSYAYASAGVSYDMTSGKAVVSATDIDKVVGVQNVVGSGQNDTITGDAADNTILGAAGDDLLSGGGGADSIDGGANFDTVDYSRNVDPVTAHLNVGVSTVDAGANGVDRMINVEAIQGSAGADLFIDAGSNLKIDGGAGVDTIDFSGVTSVEAVASDASGATVRITSGGAIYQDILTNLENIVGSAGSDKIVFSDNVNHSIIGGGGADTLAGGLGADTIAASGGESLVGGAGLDYLDYTTQDKAFSVSLAGDSAVTVSVPSGAQDTVSGFEGVLGSTFADTIYGDSGANTIIGMGGADSISGGGGADSLVGDSSATIDYSYVANPAGVTLALGATQQVANAGGEDIDIVTGFGNAIGSSGADSILGDGNANRIFGGDGADTIDGGAGDDCILGGAGNDSLVGGQGADTVSFDGAGGGVTLTLNGAATVTAFVGATERDTISGFEAVIGTDKADFLIGDGGANTLVGGDDADTIRGGGGSDSLDGGGGTDTLDYAYLNGTGQRLSMMLGADNAMSVAVSDGTNVLEWDTVANFEKIIGSSSDDTMLAAAGVAETLDGDGGNDLVSYANETQALTVTLNGAKAVNVNVGGANKDSIVNFENFAGGSGDDSITGDTQANYLGGGAGNDTLVGGAGNDTLAGGQGSDSLVGGTGTDIVDYSQELGGLELRLDQPNATVTATIGGSVQDTLTGFEGVIGTNDADLIAGGGGADFIDGGGGNDTLSGNGGNDTLRGGGGNDLIFAGGSALQLAGTNTGVDFADITGSWSASLRFRAPASGSVNAVINFVNNAYSYFGLVGGPAWPGANGAVPYAVDRTLGGRLTMSYDAPSGTMSLYWGDTLLSRETATAGVASGLAVITQLNQQGRTIAYDDISVFGTALTASQITTLDEYVALARVGNIPTALTDMKIAGLWNFEDASQPYIDVVTGANAIAPGGGGSLGGYNLSLTGDAGNDTIVGGAGADTIDGGDDNDSILGGAGSDSLVGGAGNDTISFADAASGVTLTLNGAAAVTAFVGATEKDTISGFELMIGSGKGDFLAGDDGANTLFGGDGADTIRGGGGSDSLDGGGGTDTLDYSYLNGTGQRISMMLGADNAMSVAVSDGTNVLEWDTVANFEKIIGSSSDDTMLAAAGVAETLDGDGGNDLVSYASETQALTVTLNGAKAVNVNVGGVNRDSIVNFENFIGGSGDDSITGDTQANYLGGGAGNDTLVGGAGNDTLAGGQGSDSLVGGTGTDIVDYSQELGGLELRLDQPNATVTATIGGSVQDTLTGFEGVIGTNDADLIAGGGGADFIDGGGGNDTLSGNGGNDTLRGGGGNDLIFAGGSALQLAGTNTGVDFADITGSWSASLRFRAPASGSVNAVINFVNNAYSYFGLVGGPAWPGANGAVPYAVDRTLGGRLTMSYDAPSGTMSLYWGDTLLSRETATAGVASGLAVITQLNQQGRTIAYDDISVFGTALTASQITTLDEYVALARVGNIPTALTDMKIAGLWNFEDASQPYIDVVTGANAIAPGGGGSLGGYNLSLTGDAGNDTIVGGAGADTIDGGDDNDSILGGAGSDSLVGGAGNDTISFADAASGVTLTLNGGAAVTAFVGATERDTISGFEAVIGSANGDSLTGDSGDNSLYGLGGNDTIVGGLGNDWLDGGAGNDSLVGGADADTLDGGAGADALVGGTEGDSIFGGADNDSIQGGGGNDVLDGGDGIDTVDYGYLASSASISVTAGADGKTTVSAYSNGALVESDVIANFERIVGTASNDTLSSMSTGAETLDGGAGVDIVDYQNSGPLTVAINSRSPFTIGNDVLVNVEGFRLGSGADSIVGDTAANYVDGGGGADTLYGGGGADTLIGGGGNDYIGPGTALGLPSTQGGAYGFTSSASWTYSISFKGAASNGNMNQQLNIGGYKNFGYLWGSFVAPGGLSVAQAYDQTQYIRLTETYDDSTKTAVLYLNGAQIASTVAILGPIANIAANQQGANLTFDDIELFGRALSADQVRDLNATVSGVTDASQLDSTWNAQSVWTFNDPLNPLGDLVANATYPVWGGAAGQSLSGGDGNDTVIGAYGADKLDGGSGNDWMSGFAGADSLFGGTGDDTLSGGAGNDTIDGGDGADVVSYDYATAGVTLDLSQASTTFTIGAETDVLVNIEGVIGSAYNDSLAGTGAANFLSGGAGDDTLFSGAGGADTLLGGSGNDLIRVAGGPSALASMSIDGGAHNDTVMIETSGTYSAADFAKAITNVEVLDFRKTDVAVNVDALTSSQIQSITGGGGDLTIYKDANDNVAGPVADPGGLIEQSTFTNANNQQQTDYAIKDAHNALIATLHVIG